MSERAFDVTELRGAMRTGTQGGVGVGKGMGVGMGVGVTVAAAVEDRVQRGRRMTAASAVPARARASPSRGAWLLAASGFAGLGYQVVWTRQLAVWLGHEAPAVLAVVAAIFGGFALGAATLGPRIARSARPDRWYAGCELAIGLWSAALLVLLPLGGAALQRTIGLDPGPLRQWSTSFAGVFLLFLPATAAMGATVPAIARVAARPGGSTPSIALPYAANTFGALLGVLATSYALVPVLGLRATAAVCVALNLGCAAAALRWLVPHPTLGGAGLPAAAPAEWGGAVDSAAGILECRAQIGAVDEAGARIGTAGDAGAKNGAVADADRSAARSLTFRLAITGLLGIGYEVLVVRVLSQVCEDTVYTYADLLAVYLGGSALGAALWLRWSRRVVDPARATDRLLAMLAAACLAGAATLWFAEPLRDAAAAQFRAGIAAIPQGSTFAAPAVAMVAAEALLALAAFGLPTLLMGALFAQLCDRLAAWRPGDVGTAFAVNTAGAAAAPIVFGVLLAPVLGAKLALLLVALGYLALVRPQCWRGGWPWPPLVAAALVGALAPPLVFVQVPEGGRILDYREGVAAAVSVVEDADGTARLRIDNRQQEGSSASRSADARQAWLPLLLHPAPRRALFLGLGTGVTAASAAVDPALEVDAVELLPEVVATSARFTAPILAGSAAGRFHVTAADARRQVQVATDAYDVIVADNFHPARSGSAALYTVEHFRAVRGRLARGGVFCQWLPLHQLDLTTLASIVRSYQTVFPGAVAVLASHSLATPVIGLVGGADGAARFDPTALAGRWAALGMEGGPADFGFDGPLAVLGSIVAGPNALRHFAAAAPLNTDDRPVVAWLAPRLVYAAPALTEAPAAERLLGLLRIWRVESDEGLAATTSPRWRARLAAYRDARDRFLAAGVGVRPSADVRSMLAQVQGPLLEVLQISPEFRPARAPLAQMAAALGMSDPVAAQALRNALPPEPDVPR